jgi:hypothetical protein
MIEIIVSTELHLISIQSITNVQSVSDERLWLHEQWMFRVQRRELQILLACGKLPVRALDVAHLRWLFKQL